MHFLGYYISALRGCCALKILHGLQIDQALLAHTELGGGVPPKKLITQPIVVRLRIHIGDNIIHNRTMTDFQVKCY